MHKEDQSFGDQCRCVSSKLLKFINKHHLQDEYIFWPDLAMSHYAKTKIDWLNKHNVTFVMKHMNPQNVPKARPIEDFWSILGDMVNNEKLKNRDLILFREQLAVFIPFSCHFDKIIRK